MDSQPSRGLRRDQDLEDVVDELQQNVTDERRDQAVPGNATEREQAPTRGAQDEPPD
ncbi:hypothetical protein [Mycobacterium camsae]|uniref:hypothetical protein n=1 Tax=Mycobacterium gordonae TaxID=1778 RepID=UPI001982617F|nr:hypothetical protein [Mycobacterium gordonae]